ncbi:UNC79 (predicted) [Pycnogonum litorale]
MGTRAAAFSAKIRNLHDYCVRIQHGIQPQPSEADISNTLKHFSQTLLGVLKDVPTISIDMMRSRNKDHARMSLIPNMNYKGLYTALVQLLDAIPMLQHGLHGLGHSIIYTLICLVPFLEHEYMDTLPYLVASSLAFFPEGLHKYIVDVLCSHLLPFTISEMRDPENHNYATLSTSAILMMTFQHTDNNAYHCQIMECLMMLKRDVLKDLFCVIAHGTPDSRAPAAHLLFYYWPSLNPASGDRKVAAQIKHTVWETFQCQRKNCINPISNRATKMVLDHPVVIGPGDLNPPPPPLFLCQACADHILREYSPEYMLDFLCPIQHMSHTCENKNCRSSDKAAFSTCFNLECASYNGNRPIRYCLQCNGIRHNNRRGGDHVVHADVPTPWSVDCEMQSYMVEAIVSLLKEAQPISEMMYGEDSEKGIGGGGGDDDDEDSELLKLEERRLLSRYGVWLLVGLCSPDEDTPVETLGRLLAMLFEWFYATACLIDDRAGDILEKLKTENIQGWLRKISETHFEVFVSCMFPYPVHYARVGAHWGNHMSQAESLKEGFKRLLCLVPYDVITVEVWNYIMPYWMEAFRTEISESELAEFKVLFSKVFDVDMSPLGFNAGEIYQFISKRFNEDSTQVQEKALLWLQIVTELEVFIPLDLLFSMYGSSVTSLSKVHHEDKNHLSTGAKHDQANADKHETNLTCFVLMLDILLKQMEIQEIPSHCGMETQEAKDTLILMRDIVKVRWIGKHTCQMKKNKPPNCDACELSSIWFQLCVGLLEYLCPIMETTVQDVPEEEVYETPEKATPDEEEKIKPEGISMKDLEERLNRHDLNCDDLDEVKVECGDTNVSKIMTAVEMCEPEPLDTVAMMPTEEVVTAFARAVTLTETDVGLAKCTVASATLVDENDQTVAKDQEDDNSFWHTSQGRFKFTIEELPAHLQLIHALVQNFNNYKDPDVTFYMLSCLRLMCLHAEVLSKAARDHRGFLIWAQENLLIPNLWSSLDSNHSHISQMATSLLLHSLTLPSGADTFCKILEENFHKHNWQVRFSAVEKVTLLSRFVEPVLVKSCQPVQSSVATAFVYLIRSLDDPSCIVAQRTLLLLDTIKASSIKLLCGTLEAQFDTVIVDRPMILQTIYQLYVKLDKVRFLNWDFFFNRFDALFLEAQINLEKNGEIAYPRDLRNTNMTSEIFVRKLNRAHEALTLTETQRSLTASLGTKWPYKRAFSAPAGMVAKPEKLIDKEKVYNRQSSAPLLKRKSSRFSTGFHFPNHLFPEGHLKENKEDEMQFMFLIPKIMEMEDNDKDTMHLLTFLLMQFLASPEHAYPTDEKAIAKIQNIVLKHFAALLGYSTSERGFFIPPFRLRCSPVFNACISTLPKVLDRNLSIGMQMMSTWLPLLIYCPSPQRFANEYQPTNYSLWLLDPHVRTSWLMSVLVILYKYRYGSPPLSKYIQILIHIVLNTLESHHHVCKSKFDAFITGSTYLSHSRELSSVSIDMEIGQSPSHTPPPAAGTESASKSKVANTTIESQKPKDKEETGETKDDIGFVLGNNFDVSKQSKDGKYDRQQWKSRKYCDYNYSSDVDDIEPELEAIPESPKSEVSSHQNSLMGSIGELADLRDTVTVETARVRVERPPSSSDEEGLVIMNPSIRVSDRPTVVLDPTAKVDSHMQRQLQAFERSWASSSSESGHEMQCSPDRLVPDNSEPSVPNPDISFAVIKGPDIVRHCYVAPCGSSLKQEIQSVIGRAIHEHAKKSLADDGCSMEVEPQSLTAEPCGPLTELREIRVIGNSREMVAPPCSANKAADCRSKVGPDHNKSSVFEILDASQLQDTICKAEPAVVKQVEQISTGTNNAGIKTQKFAMKTYEVPPTNPAAISYTPLASTSVRNKPYTIDLPSLTKSEAVQTVMCQERLLKVGLRKDPSKIQKFADVGVQASCNVIASTVHPFSPPLTSAIVKHSVNPVVQTVSSSHDAPFTPMRFPSQERLLPVGMSPKSRGSPATPTRKWKMLVQDIDIGENRRGKEDVTAEVQILPPPVKMQAKMEFVDDENAGRNEGNDSRMPLKLDAKIYEGPAKSESQLPNKVKGAKSQMAELNYKVVEPQHYVLQHQQHYTEITGHNFTKNLKSALEELHIQQKDPDANRGAKAASGKNGDVEVKVNEAGMDVRKGDDRKVGNFSRSCSLDVREKESPLAMASSKRFPLAFTKSLDLGFGGNSKKVPSGTGKRAAAGKFGGKQRMETKNLANCVPAAKKLVEMVSESGCESRTDVATGYETVKYGVVNEQASNRAVYSTAVVSGERFADATLTSKSVHSKAFPNHASESRFTDPGVPFAANENQRGHSMDPNVVRLEANVLIVQPQMEVMVPMESPPQEINVEDRLSVDLVSDENGLNDSSSEDAPVDDMPAKNLYKQKKPRKSALSSLENQRSGDGRKSQKQGTGDGVGRGSNVGVVGSGGCGGGAPSKRSSTTQISGSVRSEDMVMERCMDCGSILEEYSDEELGLCIVVLATFIHREPALAAPLLPEILKTVSKIGSSTMYPWQSESNVHLPGGCNSSAKQFLRCTLHQLAPNGIFTQIFQTSFGESEFFKTVASSLSDFNELNPMVPLQLLLEGVNCGKTLPVTKIHQILDNVAEYLEHLPLESCGSIWCNLLPQFESFFRKLMLSIPQSVENHAALRIVCSLLKVSAINSCKSILDPFSKVLSYSLQNVTFKFQYLLDICHLCNRTFNRERDKLLLTRTVIFELVQALKFKTTIPDQNLLMLIQFVLQDAGGSLSASIITGEMLTSQNDVQNLINTNASDCMRAHLTDAIDFVADVHTLSKLQSNFHRTAVSLNEETLGGQLKAGIAQYLALDITKGNSRDNRALSRYLPWLFNPPSSLQQGQKEFTDCVGHIRLLSWLLLGALMHSTIAPSNSTIQCQPISFEVNQHVADHIQVILAGFAEQSKASVLHMSSLFHAFILCQLWTMYCEHLAMSNPPMSEQNQTAMLTLTDFWTKVTPGILQLVSHSKVLAEMVNLHFLSLMEALLECNSTILSKLLPMWTPVLYSYQGQLPSHLQVRLTACINQPPPTNTQEAATHLNSVFLKWLKKLQFKMGQIELQSSAAIQFYSV